MQFKQSYKSDYIYVIHKISRGMANPHPRSLEQNKLPEHVRGRGGAIGPLPSPFDTIHPIDTLFGACNNRPLHFQLSVTTWCLNSFHGNHKSRNDVTSGRPLIFLKVFRSFTENGDKTAFNDRYLQNS